jgi:hypothetical protein
VGLERPKRSIRRFSQAAGSPVRAKGWQEACRAPSSPPRGRRPPPLQTHTAAVRLGTMSIYAEKDSVDGADSAVNTVGTVVGDPHLLDQELVVPDYDDEPETTGPNSHY